MENRGGNNRKVHSNPFTDMEDERTQYYLGLIAADGWVYKGIWLGMKDLDVMEDYRDWVNPNVTMFSPDKSHATYRVGFQHKETEDYVINLGITPKKSLTLEMKMPITRHFFRGVFDGDGYAPTPGQSAKVTSGSYRFLEQLRDFLSENNIESRIAVQQVVVNTTYALYITGKQFIKFYKLLYCDAHVYMKRKEERLRLVVEKQLSKLGELQGTLEQTICSQATQGCVEGSTTNSIPLEQ